MTLPKESDFSYVGEVKEGRKEGRGALFPWAQGDVTLTHGTQSAT